MDNKSWINHTEWAVLLVTLIGGFYLLDGKIERQGERTDKLYEMFCSVQKESYEKWTSLKVETDQKFYDLLKEGRK